MQLKSLSGEARLPYEITFKALKENLSAEEAVMALEVLDEHVLYAEDARLCNLSFLCPSAAQAAELAALKEGCEKDELHGVEQYMDKLGQVPYCGVRIGGLKLLRELPEDLALLTDQLTKFEDMITSFENSPCISDLLRFTLATVNLLNGDNARLKRADGFPITLLGLPGGLDAVKDANDRNVKYTIFELLFTKNRDLAESLMDALAPCFRLVSRSESRDADGNTRLNKRVVVQIENIEKELKKHTEALDEQIKELSLCLPHLPSDEALATSMPAKFQKLKQDINAMTQRKDRVNARFQKLKILFSAETHKVEVPVAGTVQSTVEKVPLSSEVWCQIWDNFFLCESPFLRADQRVREGLSKRLCKPDARVTVENLEAWWGVKKAKRGSSSTRTKSAS